MRQFFVTAIIATLAFSCNNSGKKEKETVKADSLTIGPADSAHTKPNTEKPAAPDSSKTVKLTFSGYEEGDYAHLMFTETTTGREYDFGHPDEDSLNNIPVVIKDDKTSFGYKENSKMKGAKFIADIVYIMTDSYDGNGQPVKGKEWRIVKLTKTPD